MLLKSQAARMLMLKSTQGMSVLAWKTNTAQAALMTAMVHIRAMRQMAEKIKADQQKEIGEMEPIAERLDSAPSNYKPTKSTKQNIDQLN